MVSKSGYEWPPSKTGQASQKAHSYLSKERATCTRHGPESTAKKKSLCFNRGFLCPLRLSRQNQTGFYAEHLIVREQPPAPVCFLVPNFLRNSDWDKVLRAVLLQPAISNHSPPAVPGSRKVNSFRNPQDDPRLVHPDFTVAVVEFRMKEEEEVLDRREPARSVLDVCPILEYVNASAAHHGVRRLADFQVKFRSDLSR